jgi:hypothetical protein
MWRRPPRVVWAVAIAVVVCAAIVVVAVVADVVGPRQPTHGGRQAGPSGDRDDWISAVCTEGSALESSNLNFVLPRASYRATCAAKRSPTGSAPIPIAIYEWNRDVSVVDQLARYPDLQYFAAAPTGDHQWVFAPMNTADRSILAPLTQFGFVIVPMP